MSDSPSRFGFSYGVFRPLLVAFGMGPRRTHIDVSPYALTVRFGWGFHAEVPRLRIKSVTPYDGMIGGIGVHGWRGRWLVNGSGRGLVQIDIDPPVPARVAAVVPIQLSQLRLSVDDRDRLISELGS